MMDERCCANCMWWESDGNNCGRHYCDYIDAATNADFVCSHHMYDGELITTVLLKQAVERWLNEIYSLNETIGCWP